MFTNETLSNHLNTSRTIETKSLITAEWNLNSPDNIFKIGNYRNRPIEMTYQPSDRTVYSSVPNSFDPLDVGNFYTGATDADVVVDGGLDNNDVPITFISKKEKERLLYSLEDCFGKFRPRSGINKLRYFSNKFTHHSNKYMSQRPRYYMSSRDDMFKYWTSYRSDLNIERGIANQTVNGINFIDDASPFVVYKNAVPANRIVIKMQTNVGAVDLGPFSTTSGQVPDPLYGYENQTTPSRWRVDVLKNGSWENIVQYNELSTRGDGSQIIGADGYVEIGYGLVVPEKYRSSFVFRGNVKAASVLPIIPSDGEAFLVGADNETLGTFYIGVSGAYEQFTPVYDWALIDGNAIDPLTPIATNLASPSTYFNNLSTTSEYREFQKISGIRIVVDAMNVVDATFDLIELSPRLVADISEDVLDYTITKQAADMSSSVLPVGQLLAATGTMTLFDPGKLYDPYNESGLLKEYLVQSTKVKFYEVIKNVDSYDYFVPIKTMFVEGFPAVDSETKITSIQLRDTFIYLEYSKAPELIISDVSLSSAVSTLLDSIGFSNYIFKRLGSEPDPIIPHFFISPDLSVAQVLQDLAVATQSMMYFDEYNNLVVASKEYAMPSSGNRNTDKILFGNASSGNLANIKSITSEQNDIINDGVITYSTRYIQKTYGSIKQASMVDKDISWVYKPVLLWEVSPEISTKAQNEESVSSQSSYVLAAIPLNSDLSNSIPTVRNGQLVDNVIDFGEGVYWLTKYNGYFYANGEVIKYDAVEYNVPGLDIAESATGNVWISSTREYQDYFAKIPFNGKMYPTGLVRIFAEPNYQIIDGITSMINGDVAKHGRGQFGTPVVSHSSGLSSYWSDNNNARGCRMLSDRIFSGKIDDASSFTNGVAGSANGIGQSGSRNGIIKNFLSSVYLREDDVSRMQSTQTGTIQSSALVMTGPQFATTSEARDYISYVYKQTDDAYKHFGTRMRIVGKINNNATIGQTPYGSSSYYTSISGGSGGISVLLNPETNNGYYFEIAALTTTDPNVVDIDNVYNIMFYKIGRNASATSNYEPALPKMLWGGIGNILVDDGNFTGQYRLASEENPTVYDLAVEYESIGSTRRFYLYINNKLVQIVDDEDPLPIYNNMALFVRGSAKCMFENIYALGFNYSQNTSNVIDLPANTVFTSSEITVNESLRKYAMSGIIQSTYLSGISTLDEPSHKMYFEEFGTIMRQAEYMKVRYDKAYPALSAQISPTFNRIKGYTVSGFMAGAYGAEFLIFNNTDTAITLDEASGNYLRIQGVTFTQQSDNQLTVDDYFSKRSSLSDPITIDGDIVISPIIEKQLFQNIKNNRLKNGIKSFALSSPYIQSTDSATSMMSWIVNKSMKKRLSIGVEIFPDPTIQLGDIVSISYKDSDENDVIVSDTTQLVVYNIIYGKSVDGPSMTLFLSEVGV